MKGSKWLGQIIKEERVELGSNTLIIAPTGSGKTFYIFNELCVDKDKQYLYLCDTRNLRYAINKDLIKHNLPNVMVMCYESFGKEVKNDTLNTFINQFDMIICDEAHNMVNFQTFSKSPNLAIAQIKLFDKYEHTKIVMFTATPSSLQNLEVYNKNIAYNFKPYDFRYGYDIREYENLREAYFGHFSDIEKQLAEYGGYFREGYQALIFTPRVGHMLDIEESCIKLGLKPISIWSDNNERELTNEQIRVREYLLEHQELHSDYNVLIINRASETGINIENWSKEEKPHKMNLMIIHSLDETQTIQARGRVRHDLELLIVQTKESEKLPFAIDEDLLLDKWLTKGLIEEFIIVKNNMRDAKGRLITTKGLASRLICQGYIMESKKKQIDGKRCTMYKITKIK